MEGEALSDGRTVVAGRWEASGETLGIIFFEKKLNFKPNNERADNAMTGKEKDFNVMPASYQTDGE